MLLGGYVFTVRGKKELVSLDGTDIVIVDREDGALYQQIIAKQSDCDESCKLSFYTLKDLGLDHGSRTQDIYAAAETHEMRIVPYNIALRLLLEHPTMFCPDFWHRLRGEKFPFPSCLLGIEPLAGPSGHKYVVEIADKMFRFRMADDDIRWSNHEYWIFVT
jgi:hypothetical protein